MEKDKKGKIDNAVAGLIIVGVAVTILFTVLFMCYVKHPAFSTSTIDPAIFGQYGDVLGGVVGTLLGFLTVYLLYLTYTSQKTELAETRVALKAQKMDSAFFNLLNMLDNIRSKHDYSKMHAKLMESLQELDGIHFMNLSIDSTTGKFISAIEREYAAKYTNPTRYEVEDLRQQISNKHLQFYRNYPERLGHYFRNIYNIMKYIKENDLAEVEERRYINLLKAQLSSDELGLIFYNALSDVSKNGKGEFRFKQWLDEYGFLENIDPSGLKHRWHHWFYWKTEFVFMDDNSSIEVKRKYMASLKEGNTQPN